MSSSKLGDVAQYLRGINFKPDDIVAVGTAGTVACMRTKNIQESLDCSDVWGVSEDFVRRPEQILQEGDMLVSSANSWNLVGKCCWIPNLPWKTTFGGFVSALRADPKQVNPRYLYWWFSSDRTQALLRSFGRKTTSISNLSAEQCLNLDVPLPPLPEQRRIAALLDQADALRAKRREALAQLDSLTQSIFIEMFGDPVANPMNWPVASLTDVCHCYSGGTPSKACPEYWQGTLPWFSAKDLKADDLFDSQDHIAQTVPETTNLRLLPANTIAFCVRGMILAHTFQVSVLRVPATINQDLKALFPKEPIETEYLAECIRAQSNFVLQQVSEAGHGTKRLDALGLREIRVLQPPERLQKVFASHAHAIRALRNHHSTALAELDVLFTSLQHRAFRGEL